MNIDAQQIKALVAPISNWIHKKIQDEPDSPVTAESIVREIKHVTLPTVSAERDCGELIAKWLLEYETTNRYGS